MKWKLKAALQNTIDVLPAPISYALYFKIQRTFGGLHRIDPLSRFAAAIETWKRIKAFGGEPIGKTFLEIGTGAVPTIPIGYWLMGANHTMTIDINPYMRDVLIKELIAYVTRHSEIIKDLFGSFLLPERLDALMSLGKASAFQRPAFLNLCNLSYIAPGNAAKTDLPAASVDFHTSYTVFEHIPPDVLTKVLLEGNRVVSTSGLFVHYVDYSDHFSHSDPTLSAIHFLQLTDNDWLKYAGNRFMYANRLRHDDLIDVFRHAGHEILASDPICDQSCLELLNSGAFRLDKRFREKTHEVLATTGSWIVSRACRQPSRAESLPIDARHPDPPLTRACRL
jgi:hypothetical protein